MAPKAAAAKKTAAAPQHGSYQGMFDHIHVQGMFRLSCAI
jgi:hypothetical protein